MVTVNLYGRPVGDNADKLATRAGKLVRAYCPVKYVDWRQVPDNFKEDVWFKLLQEFEFNVPNHLAKMIVMRSLPQKFRTYKHDLRTGPLLGKVTMQEKLDARPVDFDSDCWKIFVENESIPGIKEKHAKYSENQKKRTIHHTCGRESYANKIHKLAVKEGLVAEAARGLAWMDVHVGKDGKEQVKAARARRKELIDAGLVSALDFENDEIAEVFGPDKCRAGLLGYSPLVSKKQALYASVATAVMNANTNPTITAPRTDHMVEALLPKHTELITNVVLQVMAKQQQNQHSASTNPAVGGYVVYGIDGEHCEGLLVQPEERKSRLPEAVVSSGDRKLSGRKSAIC
ncbi:hypothetical protein C5167_018896 [Papaver somniferum]|uniref:Uncharacterized protein n=1 Tax=Papaver somniferum TaxID=3469 RepID=A0A4Y7IRP1_PAPSO|nr:hypothetical protein C5167_018896 [Papaver somniferum]